MEQSKKFIINVLDRHYSQFQVKAKNLYEAKEIVINSVGDDPNCFDSKLVEKIEIPDPIITEYYDNQWDEIYWEGL